MEYAINKHDDACGLTLRGQFTFNDNSKIRDIISTVQDNSPQALDIDVSELAFVDSAALGMFLLLSDEMEKSNINMTMNGANGQVKKMLQLSKFDEIFPVTYGND